MNFTFVRMKEEKLPSTALRMDGDDMVSFNEPPLASDCYFCCGDLVFNYNKSTGEVLTATAYLPQFSTLPINDFTIPDDVIAARFLVGDLSAGIFSIDDLKLATNNDRSIIHAGDYNSADVYVKSSEKIIFGLSNEKIKEIFLIMD